MFPKYDDFIIESGQKLWMDNKKHEIYLKDKKLILISDNELKNTKVSIEILDYFIKILVKAYIKICIIGEKDLGRYFIDLCKLKSNFSKNYISTLGMELYRKDLKIDKKQVLSQLWILSTDKEFRFLYKTYIKGSSAVIFIFNLMTDESIELLKYHLLACVEEESFKKKYFRSVLAINSKSKRDLSDIVNTYKFYKVLRFSKTNPENLEKILDDIAYNIYDEILAPIGGINAKINLKNLIELKYFILKIRKHKN